MIHRSPTSPDIFKITFQTNSYALIQSLLNSNLILGGTTNHAYDCITFKASTVTPLKSCAYSIRDVLQMTKSLSIQLHYLITHQSSTVLGYHSSNIIMIDEQLAVYVGPTVYIENEYISVTSPFSSVDMILSPELRIITELPASVHYKSSYYSLAMLLVYLLKGDNEDNDNGVEDDEDEDDEDSAHVSIPNKAVNTKLGWLLSRCFTKDPRQRSILLI